MLTIMYNPDLLLEQNTKTLKMPTPLRVLILQNQPSDAQWMLAPVRQAGYEPRCQQVDNQKDYLRQMESLPDLILVDDGPQDLCGNRALSLMRQRGLDIPLIVVNGAKDHQAVVEAIRQGAADYLVKERIHELGHAVQRALADKKRRDQRKRQELEQQTIVTHIPMGLMMSDDQGTVQWVNQEMAAMFDLSPQAMVGKNWYAIVPAMEEHRKIHDRVFIGEAMEFFEARIPFPEGDRYFEVHYRPIADEAKKVLGMLTMAQEITKRKRTEAKVKQTYQDLKRSEKMLAKALADLKMSHEELKATQLQLIQAEKLESVGRLAAGVAHEVKNPLAIIQLDVDYLSKNLTFEDENTSMILEDIHHAVQRADSVVKGLLNFSASGDLVTSPEPLEAVIEGSLVLVKHELDRWHINVVRDFGASLPRVKVDRNKIEQVFVNVFINAIHAMPDGGTLTVRTRLERLGQMDPNLGDREGNKLRAGDTVVVAGVEDTGTGIPEDQLSRIFDPFFTTKPTGKGTGLGLTVTNKIVELHGGMIEIKNRNEGGVRVRVMFKAHKEK